MREWTQIIKLIYVSLDFHRKIVGVNFLKTEEEFIAVDAMIPKRSMNYCGAVKSATMGNKIKLSESSIACKSGVKVLGINPTDSENSKGENWTRLGVYKDSVISESVRSQLTYNKEKIYGVLVQPIEFYEEVPDVVIIITNPYNIMRLTQGYSYNYGMPQNINFIGNQAICLECTARPFVKDDLNISMLCIGTRHRAGWKDNEMAMGIPGHKFEGLVDGVFNTINIMESNNNKRNIDKKLKDKDISDFKVMYDYNYYKNI